MGSEDRTPGTPYPYANPTVEVALCRLAATGSSHYLADPSPDETAVIIAQLDFSLPSIGQFDVSAGLEAVAYALRLKGGGKMIDEDLGPAGRPGSVG